ncbi:hypothetical protein K0U07_00545 [bacterium]|nr:hypothetical protein [bacterium]
MHRPSSTIPHIDVIHELDEALEPILASIEPLHAYFYSLSSKAKKKDRLKATAFYFVLEHMWSKETALDVILPFYRDVTYMLIVFSEIEKYRDDFIAYKSLHGLTLTAIALKNNIADISADINNIKEKSVDVTSKMLCKRLFHYIESVRALIEELISLKIILLEDITTQKELFLMKEPLDLERDLE